MATGLIFPLAAKFSSSTPAVPKLLLCDAAKRSLIQSAEIRFPSLSCYSEPSASTATSPDFPATAPPPVRKRKKRYRKLYPGETEGITEEMRFVAMRLRNANNKVKRNSGSSRRGGEIVSENDSDGDGSTSISSMEEEENGGGVGGDGETWQPSVEGFVKFLVDNKLVFDTVERIVDESLDVSYAYFRKTGLERSESLSQDIEWFSQQNVLIPEPSNPGVTYANYLEYLAEKSPPLFLSHFYNIYFSHIAGGQVIAMKVSKMLLEGRGLKFFSWKGDAEDLLRCVRDKLNMVGEHWSRDEKNKCLREATKSFRYLGQIVRLIIL